MKVKEGTVVFISGGASGLGLATARMMHTKGSSVCVADLDVAGMQELHAELQDRILCVKCDVSKEEDVKNAIDKTVATFGTIHVALASAGVLWLAPTLSSAGSLNTKIFESVMAINVLGSAYIAKYAA